MRRDLRRPDTAPGWSARFWTCVAMRSSAYREAVRSRNVGPLGSNGGATECVGTMKAAGTRVAMYVSAALTAVLLSGCSGGDDSPKDDTGADSTVTSGPDDSSIGEVASPGPSPVIEVLEGPSVILVRSADGPSDSRPASLVGGTVIADGGCLSLRSETGDVSPLLLPPGSVVDGGSVELPDGAIIVEGEEFEADGFWMPVSELATPLPACPDADLVAFVFSPEGA